MEHYPLKQVNKGVLCTHGYQGDRPELRTKDSLTLNGDTSSSPFPPAAPRTHVARVHAAGETAKTFFREYDELSGKALEVWKARDHRDVLTVTGLFWGLRACRQSLNAPIQCVNEEPRMSKHLGKYKGKKGGEYEETENRKKTIIDIFRG